MDTSELFRVIEKVIRAESYQELAAILDAEPELLTQDGFNALMEMARQARQNGRGDLNEAIMFAMEKIAPFAVGKTAADRRRSSPPANNAWTLKIRRSLALRQPELLREALAETFDQTEIAAFLQAFISQNINELDPIADRLIPALFQANRREEALTINLLHLDARAGLAEGQHRRFPVERQREMRELGIKSCFEAIEISRNLGDKPCEAIYLLRLAGGFRFSRQFPEAEKFYSLALSLYRELAEREPLVFVQFLAMALDVLGVVKSELRKLAESEKIHLEVLQIYRGLAAREAFRFKPELAMALTNLGNIQRDLRKLTEAEETFSEALKIKRLLATREPQIFDQSVAVTVNNLGAVQFDLQKLAEAEISYAEALSIYRKLNLTEPQFFKQSVAMTLNNLGVVQTGLKNLTDAENSLAEALRLRRELALHEPHIFNPDVATTLNNLGSAQFDLNKFNEAEKSYTEALEIKRALAANEPGIFEQSLAMTLSNLGVAQSRSGKLAEAENSLTEALRIRRGLALGEADIFAQDVADTLNNLGAVKESEQNFAEAESLFNEALRIYQTAALKAPEIFDQNAVRTLNNLGNLKFEQNLFDESVRFFESARNLIENLRARALTIDDRRRILQENVAVYSGLLACYLKMKNWEKALEIAELGKSRSLSDLLDLKSEELQPKAPNAETLAIVKNLGEKYREAIKQLQRLESFEKYLSRQLSLFETDLKRIRDDDGGGDDDTRREFLRQLAERKQPLETEKQKTRDARFAAQAGLKKILGEINEYDRDFPTKAQAISGEKIFEISRELNRTILMFRILRDTTAIIFVFPSGDIHIEEVETFGEREMFYLFRDEWLFPYERWKKQETDINVWKNAIERTLREIYEKLLIHAHRILRQTPGSGNILFVPNRSLALLPLHAACWQDADGKPHYLLDEFTVTYAPSVSVFRRCRENEPARSDKTLLVTNPQGDLDSAESEVAFIQELHAPSRNLLREAASKSAVIEALRDDYGFAHFSCHGFYHQENPFDSGLLMSDEALKLGEIINCDLRNNWLTTLSACETGMVDFQSPTDEHFGLPLGFIFAGSPSVWASLWSVSDLATSELMRKAYENLSRAELRDNKPEALRQAQLALRKDFKHPFFWAGFQHFGV